MAQQCHFRYVAHYYFYDPYDGGVLGNDDALAALPVRNLTTGVLYDPANDAAASAHVSSASACAGRPINPALTLFQSNSAFHPPMRHSAASNYGS
jgi:hypothetical protein